MISVKYLHRRMGFGISKLKSFQFYFYGKN
jgi:hypothetical protein